MQEDDVIGKAYDSRLMRRLLEYLRPYWRSVVLALAAIITHSVLQLAPPYLTKIAIDGYIPARDLSGLGVMAAIYLVVLVASFILEYIQTWTMQATGQRIMFDMRMQMVEHLQRLDLRFYDRNPVGRLMTRVTSDVETLNGEHGASAMRVMAVGERSWWSSTRRCESARISSSSWTTGGSARRFPAGSSAGSDGRGPSGQPVRP